MGIIVRIEGQKALLRAGEWRCADLRIEARLNALTEAWIQACGGPALNSCDPELEVAREMASRLNGRILAAVPASGNEAARKYFRLRQLRLFG